jgi:hypothetical protein
VVLSVVASPDKRNVRDARCLYFSGPNFATDPDVLGNFVDLHQGHAYRSAHATDLSAVDARMQRDE